MQVHNNSFPEMISATIRDNYPPLYNVAAWGFVEVFGDAEWVLRLPAALFGDQRASRRKMAAG